MDATPQKNLPYFTFCLAELPAHEGSLGKMFGRNVHWGYWPNPAKFTFDVEDFSRASDALNERLFRFANSTKSLLDAGCGFGGTIAFLDQQWNNARFVGLNIDPRQLDRAKAKVQSTKNSIEWVEGDACELPFPDSSFDLVSAVECIFHFPSRSRFFAEAKRVLKPGGRLLLSDFVVDLLRMPLAAVVYLRNFASLSRVYGDHNHVAWTVGSRLGTYPSLAKKHDLSIAGFEDITKNTLPTFEFLSKYGEMFGDGSRDFLRANHALALASRLGALRYQLYAFEKK